jgi:hypothetical protein
VSVPTVSQRSLGASVVREAGIAAAVLGAGLVVGGVWAVWAPALAHSADLGEAKVSVDGLLALLGIGAGLVTAVVLVLLPGPRPAVRLPVVLAATAVGGLLAVLVGAARGLSLGAPGVTVLWPLTTAVLTALRTLASIVASPDDAPWWREPEFPNGEVSEPPQR